MDTDTLVENRIEDGRRLIENLPQHGFEVSAAFWLKASEDGKWSFYIISPVVDRDGLTKAYRQLHPRVRTMPQALGIDPLEIKLIGSKDPVARDVLAIVGRAPAPLVSPIRWGGNQLGNVIVEGAYIYPMPVSTP
jgi:hypothetical protein